MKKISCVLLLAFLGAAQAQNASVPQTVLLRIVHDEDHRDWNEGLAALLRSTNPAVRRRAVLATGRIGDIRSLPTLTRVLAHDPDAEVQAAAAFALGLMASPESAHALLHVLHDSSAPKIVRARAVEALGKVAADLPALQKRQKDIVRREIYRVLNNEHTRSDHLLVLLALTAALRAGPSPNTGKALAPYLFSPDTRARADAENVLARLHISNPALLLRLRILMTTDPDPDVRANAARALAAARDTNSADALTRCALSDPDVRVRVSAVRVLGSLRVQQASSALLGRARILQGRYDTERRRGIRHPAAINELLEIAAYLGQALPDTDNAEALSFLNSLRNAEREEAPELEIAVAQIAPGIYLAEKQSGTGWRVASARAQGLGVLALYKSHRDAALSELRLLIQSTPAQALPDVLRAFAGFHAPDTRSVLQVRLDAKDVFVRATAAELLGDLPPDPQTAHVLADALPQALHEQPNDAARYILAALAAQHTAFADAVIRSALSAPDRVVRGRAAELLRTNGAGDFSQRIGTSIVRLTDSDYRRATLRQSATATVTTDKGRFVIKLLPQDAPLTVDSFIRLARHGFFKDLTFHRVVPDFVVQGGDPRGDGNGGPGYALRDEFNTVPYGRGTVGMALDGPDTGGSQWFVTHAPQPHLDGHYTVFGQVVRGMDVVDRLARGDRMLSVDITERNRSGILTHTWSETNGRRTYFGRMAAHRGVRRSRRSA